MQNTTVITSAAVILQGDESKVGAQLSLFNKSKQQAASSAIYIPIKLS